MSNPHHRWCHGCGRNMHNAHGLLYCCGWCALGLRAQCAAACGPRPATAFEKLCIAVIVALLVYVFWP